MRAGLRAFGVIALVLGSAAAVLSGLAGDDAGVVAAVAYLTFPVVALVIARREPRNPVAWVYVAAATLLGVEVCGQQLTTLGLAHGWPDPAVHVAAWAQSWSWFPGLFLLITVGLLRFPDGRLPSRRWRWVERTSYAGMAVWSLGIGTLAALVPVRELASDATPHPHGFAAVAFDVGQSTFGVVGVCAVAALVSLVLRYRHSDLVGREQVKWVMWAAGVAVVLEAGLDSYGTATDGTPDWLQSVGEGLGFALIAVATGIAITRFNLYEIDRIISRTLAYAVVLLVLATLYVGALLGLAAIVPTDLGQLGVAVATLAVSALAVPLTRRVRHRVDRRFNRSRFDAEQIVAGFAADLRARPDVGDVPGELVDVLRRTVQPSHASVWLARP